MATRSRGGWGGRRRGLGAALGGAVLGGVLGGLLNPYGYGFTPYPRTHAPLPYYGRAVYPYGYYPYVGSKQTSLPSYEGTEPGDVGETSQSQEENPAEVGSCMGSENLIPLTYGCGDDFTGSYYVMKPPRYGCHSTATKCISNEIHPYVDPTKPAPWGLPQVWWFAGPNLHKYRFACKEGNDPMKECLNAQSKMRCKFTLREPTRAKPKVFCDSEQSRCCAKDVSYAVRCPYATCKKATTFKCPHKTRSDYCSDEHAYYMARRAWEKNTNDPYPGDGKVYYDPTNNTIWLIGDVA